MKSLLILISIIALVFSTPVEETNDIKDYIEIVKCFLEQQPLIDDVNSIVEMIKTQDFSQAITLLFKAYGAVQAAISKWLPNFPSSTIRDLIAQCETHKNYWLSWLAHLKKQEMEWSFDKTEEKIMEEYEKWENAKKYIDFDY